MPTPVSIRRRRGTTAQHKTFVGADGEITIDSDKHTAVVHDGVTPGGFALLKEPSDGSKTYQITVIDGAVALVEQA